MEVLALGFDIWMTDDCEHNYEAIYWQQSEACGTQLSIS